MVGLLHKIDDVKPEPSIDYHLLNVVDHRGQRWQYLNGHK